jgi:hypothetical protein
VLIEKALDAKSLPEELAGRAKKLLEGRSRATALVISSSGGLQVGYGWQGWQERSRQLYQLAAEVAKLPSTQPAERK